MKSAGLSGAFSRGLHAVSALCAVTLVAGIAATPASAQGDASSYPNKPIRVIVPYPPGGGADILARILSEKVQAKWGQPIIIDNRSGAGGNLGTEAVYRAAPDGYTLLFTAQPPLVANKSLYSKLSFDPDALTPVAVMATAYSVLLVNPKVPANNVRELIAYAKANPGKLNYASQGIGNAAHLTAELFNSQAGIKLVHIPYKGTGPALADLIGGQVDVMFGELATAGPHIRAGKLRVLGTGGEKRHPALPDVPTIGETVPKFVAPVWQGMVAPPGTPAAITNKWAAAINEVLKQPDVANRLREMSMIPAGGTPEDMAQFMKEERERWGSVIRATGARAD
jgi:tripartite-type tricarboxylate transporter receptor subunit TctC